MRPERPVLSRIALASLLALAACTDQPVPITSPATPAQGQLATRSMLGRFGTPRVDAVVRNKIDDAARRLAMRLADRQARGRLVGSLRASTADDEHKLLLAQAEEGVTYGAARALARGVKARAPHARDFEDLTGEMEVYMPVRAQRESYDGTEPLLVAWQVDEEEAPIAYNAQGERIVLSAEVAPEAPVLVLVPREGALKQVKLDAKCKNAKRKAEAIGTWACQQAITNTPSELTGNSLPSNEASERPNLNVQSTSDCHPDAIICEEDPEQPPPTYYVPPPAGFYLTDAYLSDLHENWPRGDPEITYLITTVPTFGNSNDTQVSCLSEAPLPNNTFYLNQDANTQQFPIVWFNIQHTYTNKSQITDMQAIASSRGMETADVKVAVWEDDLGSKCSLDEDNVFAKIQQSISTITSIVGTVKGFNKCVDLTQQAPGSVGDARKKFQSITSLCGLLKIPGQIQTLLAVFGGDDDYIGISAEVADPDTNNGWSHVISSQGGQVGRYNITGINQQ